MNTQNATWFNVFTICKFWRASQRFLTHISAVFELVSGYGTVGLSLGIPTVCILRPPARE